MVAPADRRCTAKIYLHRNSYPPPPQCLRYPSLRNLLFSFASSLFDFSELVIPGPGLSKRLRSIKYSFALINCSPSPFGGVGGKKGKKRMTLNYSGLNQGYFWRLPRLRWDGAVGSSVCVFWCGGSVNSMSILRCHNCRHYTIMQGSSDAHFTPDDNFLSLPHGCRTSIDQLNRYMMLCKEICSILHTDKQCERPDVGKKKEIKAILP